MHTNPEGWVLACDIDNTILPMSSNPPRKREDGYEALGELCTTVELARFHSEAPIYFGSVTGRSIASHTECEGIPAFSAAVESMDFKITSVGAEIHTRTSDGFAKLEDWPPAAGWDAAAVHEALSVYPELGLQPAIAQGDYKVSFDVTGETDDNYDEYVAKIATRLAETGVAAHVIFSAGVFLDILPQGVNKGTGLLHTINHLTQGAEERLFIIGAGDSMNDIDLLQVADLALIPHNANESLKQWAQKTIPADKLYIAHQPFASGIDEGVQHFLSR